MVTVDDWRHCFPFPTLRPEQEQAINFALESFLSGGKRFVIAELGTGVGKSAIAVTVARYLATQAPGGDAYVLTTQKILQEQYMDDFGPSSGLNAMRSLRSSSNYSCRYYADQTCAESRRLLQQLGKRLVDSEFHSCCRSACPYVLDKQEFMDFPVGITNFSYFLAETMYAKQLQPRSLLVIDECHNVEAELSKFVEVTFSERFAETALSIKAPRTRTDATIVGWIRGPYRAAVEKQKVRLGKRLGSANVDREANAELQQLSKQYEMLDKHLCKVDRFIGDYDSSPTNWVMNTIEPPPGGKVGRKYEFKPVDVAPHAHGSLYDFGERVLLMSATVIDKDTYCRSVGIDPDATAFIHIATPFPVSNRPIHYLGAGSMARNSIDSTLPHVVAIVKQLLELHANDKGIVHCVNYRIAQHLFDALRNDRLLLHGSGNREDTIKEHLAAQRPTVLLSPSMTEGVDLADTASRFQVLCKVPFPYLGDRVIQLRKERNGGWYACQTARSVIQALGRSIRNADDYATSYILDSDWERFYRMNSTMFPPEFKAALQQ